MSEVYVSPTGTRMQVATPEVAIRMRARGWKPESEPTPAQAALAEPAAKPAPPKPAAPKSAES